MTFLFDPLITRVFSGLQFFVMMLSAAQVLTPRWKTRRTAAVMLGGFALFNLVPYLPLLSSLRMMAGILVLFVTVSAAYREKWYLKLALAGALLLVMMLSELLMMPIVQPFLLWTDVPVGQQLVLFLMELFVFLLFNAVLVWGIRWFRKRVKGENRFPAMTLLVVLVPIGQYLAFTGWFWAEPPYVIVSPAFIVVTLLVFLASDISIAVVLIAASRSAALHAQNELLQAQVAAEEAHYAALAENYEDIRRMRHDIANHLYAIRALIEDGKNERASDYAEKLSQEELAVGGTLVGCGNPVAASYLLHRQKELAARDMTLDFDLAVPPELSIPDLDVICVLGNLLDNAAEACAGIPGAKIRLSGRIRRGYLQLEVRNPRPPEMAEKSRRIPELPRGLGQEILQRLAGRYDGYYSCGPEGDGYCAQLFLKVDERKGADEE